MYAHNGQSCDFDITKADFSVKPSDLVCKNPYGFKRFLFNLGTRSWLFGVQSIA